jgi:hypothetical protein
MHATLRKTRQQPSMKGRTQFIGHQFTSVDFEGQTYIKTALLQTPNEMSFSIRFGNIRYFPLSKNKINRR